MFQYFMLVNFNFVTFKFLYKFSKNNRFELANTYQIMS